MTELYKLTAVEAVRLLKRREVSPLEMIDAAAARIADTDRVLNALPTLCLERARERARRLMQNPPADPPPHYLYGLPIAVKDNTDVEGVRCTYASRIYAERIAPASDIVVERLEHNGALVIGKSNLPEFAAGGNTFNDVFGATRNPWDTRMTAGGSSGGAAAALASGQVWLATGGDFGGSIRQPASFCSLVGLRPSPGRVPRVQKQPLSPLSVEGPMARTVADCALMFDAEVGADARDPLSQPAPAQSFSAAAARPQKPARVAFSPDLGIAPVVSREVAALCKHAAEMLSRNGIAVEQACPDLGAAEKNFQILRGAVFVARFGTLLEPHRDLFKREIIENTEFGLRLAARDVVAAEIAHGELIRRVARFFESYDLLLCPVVICPPFPVEQRYPQELDGVKLENYMSWLILTYAITMTLCPALSLPCGFTRDGLPVGLQLIAPPRGEARLFAHAALLERLLDVAPFAPIDPITR